MSKKLPSYILDPDAVLKDVPTDTKWRHSLPNYDKATQLFHKHSSTHHAPGSLEDMVQNLVKNWEKGLFYILIPYYFNEFVCRSES